MLPKGLISQSIIRAVLPNTLTIRVFDTWSGNTGMSRMLVRTATSLQREVNIRHTHDDTSKSMYKHIPYERVFITGFGPNGLTDLPCILTTIGQHEHANHQPVPASHAQRPTMFNTAAIRQYYRK